MTAPLSTVWTFAAVDGVNVQCPRALTAGVARIIGKRYDAAVEGYVAGEPTRYEFAKKRDAEALRSLFAKHLRLGQLTAADAVTAADFGVQETP